MRSDPEGSNRTKPQKLTIFSDGAARGNPGPAGAGVVLMADGRQVGKAARYLGERTNNQAEYMALIIGLEVARRWGIEEVDCCLDSELVVKQLRGEYRVKDPTLRELHERVRAYGSSFRKMAFSHVKRELNREADALANEAIDTHLNRPHPFGSAQGRL